jgi:hypothetical protein
VNPEETLQKTSTLLMSDDELRVVIQNDEGLAPIQVAEKLELLLQKKPLLQRELAELSRNLTYQKKNGQVVLNPVFEGALSERVLIDGDIPELRAGALQEGMRPAVPVRTSSRNLIEVGYMLEKASEEVRTLLLEAQPSDELQLRLFEGIEGYRKGHLPALREVQPSSSLVVLAFPEEKKRELVWRALATTQGRRTLLNPLQEGIQARSPQLQFQKDAPEGACEVSWTVQAFGPEDLDPDFALIEVVISSLVKQIPQGATHFSLKATSSISDRVFGWVLSYWEVR